MTQKAIVSPNEPCPLQMPDGSIIDGWRIAQVAEAEFPIAEPMFWIDCADDVQPNYFVYNEADQQIYPAAPPM